MSEALKKLPADLVTQDIDDPDRVCPGDAYHVGATIVADAKAHEQAPKPVEAEQPVDYWRPVSQPEVDKVRLRIMSALIKTLQIEREAGTLVSSDLAPRHVWFPSNDMCEYEMRAGNAPAAAQRPKHLRRLALEIDITTLPESIARAIRSDAKIKAIYAKEVHDRVSLAIGMSPGGIWLQ